MKTRIVGFMHNCIIEIPRRCFALEREVMKVVQNIEGERRGWANNSRRQPRSSQELNPVVVAASRLATTAILHTDFMYPICMYHKQWAHIFINRGLAPASVMTELVHKAQRRQGTLIPVCTRPFLREV